MVHYRAPAPVLSPVPLPLEKWAVPQKGGNGRCCVRAAEGRSGCARKSVNDGRILSTAESVTRAFNSDILESRFSRKDEPLMLKEFHYENAINQTLILRGNLFFFLFENSTLRNRKKKKGFYIEKKLKTRRNVRSERSRIHWRKQFLPRGNDLRSDDDVFGKIERTKKRMKNHLTIIRLDDPFSRALPAWLLSLVIFPVWLTIEAVRWSRSFNENAEYL